MSHISLINKNYCKKQQIDIIIVVVKKKLLSIIFKIIKFKKKYAENKYRNLSKEERK